MPLVDVAGAARSPFVALDLAAADDGQADRVTSYGHRSAWRSTRTTSPRRCGVGRRDVVVGHSMGAFVAVALAAEHPDSVRALVLIDGGLPLETAARRRAEPTARRRARAADGAAARDRLRHVSEAYLDFWRALPPFEDGRWNAWVEAYRRTRRPRRQVRKPHAAEGIGARSADDFLDTLRRRTSRRAAPWRLSRATLCCARPGLQLNPETQPPLLPDDLVARRGAALPRTSPIGWSRTPRTTRSRFGPRGREVVADAIVEWAEAVGR